jgi:transcriptional antiterminator NusG
MIDENAPGNEENATDIKADSVPPATTGEGAPRSEIHHEAATASPPGETTETTPEPMDPDIASEITPEEQEPKTTRKETERELEPEAPKPAKKPRKAVKTTASAVDAASDAPTEEAVASPSTGEASPDQSKKWYVVKVQSGREDSIKAAIERKVKIEGLEEFFGQIAIPVEEIVQKKSVRVTDKKTGDKVTQEKKVIKHMKKFPGYIFAEVDYNDRILYLFRETSGVGDFVGASLKRDPTPMTDREVRAMLTGVADGDHGKPNQKQKVKLDYEKGDKVKIRDGAFANMEGIVKSITETKDTGETPKVKVEVTIFGRPVEVDLDYWHVDKA